MKQESTRLSKAQSKDFADQIADVLLLNLECNTDDKSMSYQMALKVDQGSISLKELREILVLAGIREITIENATINIEAMELQIKKEYYLFSLLEGWLKMEVNFTNSSQEYLPTKKRKYCENSEPIDEMTFDAKISYEEFKTNVQMLLS
jgi:predicted ATPase